MGAATVSLALFVINGMLFEGGTSVRGLNAGTIGILVSFLLAAGALGCAIAANASAYLNPSSDTATKILSPPLILAVALLVLPFFIALGLSMAG